MRIVNPFSFLLTSLCVRFPGAMPPVWLRWTTLNWPGVNHFGLDYPLGCDWFLWVYLSGLDLLDLRSAGGRCREMPRSTLRSSVSGVGGCSRSFSDVVLRADEQHSWHIVGTVYGELRTGRWFFWARTRTCTRGASVAVSTSRSSR